MFLLRTTTTSFRLVGHCDHILDSVGNSSISLTRQDRLDNLELKLSMGLLTIIMPKRCSEYSNYVVDFHEFGRLESVDSNPAELVYSHSIIAASNLIVPC